MAAAWTADAEEPVVPSDRSSADSTPAGTLQPPGPLHAEEPVVPSDRNLRSRDHSGPLTPRPLGISHLAGYPSQDRETRSHQR